MSNTEFADVVITSEVMLRVELTLGGDEALQFDDGEVTGEVFDDTGLYRAWPASTALCRWMLSNPEAVSGKRVLELGAGTGLPSLLAAQHCHAQQVLATDTNTQALAKLEAAAAKDATLCQGKPVPCLRTACLDFDDAAAAVELAVAERPEVVLLADVVYPAKNFSPLLKTLQALLKTGDGGDAPPPTVLIASTRRDAQVHAAFESGLRSLEGLSLELLGSDRSEGDPLYGTGVDVRLYRLTSCQSHAQLQAQGRGRNGSRGSS